MTGFRRWALVAATALGGTALAAPALAAPDPAAAACHALTALRIPDLRIVDATLVTPSPRWDSPRIHADEPTVGTMTKPFCRVQGVIEKEIEFEQWLPLAADWNGRMLGNGNGGFAGFIRYDGLAMGATRGFTSVSTNTGHREGEKDWAIDEPKRLENYGHRAQHLLAVDAKKIAAAFYGSAPKHSYFLGCSGGGMQAMNEVQRYPADYDGIIAGASGQSIVGISARWLASALYARREPADNPTLADWKTIQAHAVSECDKADGVVDGVIGRPDLCRAKIGETPGLSPAKAKIAESLAGPILAKDGAVLFPAFPPGVAYSPLTEPGKAGEAFAQWYYNDARWDFDKFDAARDVPLVEAATPGVSFTNPNLAAFQRRGGKLIAAHGLTDQIVPAQSTVDYHAAVARFMGDKAADNFFRLFLAPGVDHCRGGAGADRFTMSASSESPTVDADHDLLAAMVRWVEEGVAPDRVIASKVVDGKVTMTRPVCAFPAVPKYRGRGDTNDAASFVCSKA